jgi:hypothetical protein
MIKNFILVVCLNMILFVTTSKADEPWLMLEEVTVIGATDYVCEVCPDIDSEDDATQEMPVVVE